MCNSHINFYENFLCVPLLFLSLIAMWCWLLNMISFRMCGPSLRSSKSPWPTLLYSMGRTSDNASLQHFHATALIKKLRIVKSQAANCYETCFVSHTMLSASSFWVSNRIHAIVLGWSNIDFFSTKNRWSMLYSMSRYEANTQATSSEVWDVFE